MRTVFSLMRPAIVAAALMAGLALAPAVAAQSTFDVSILAGACANCHGTDGRSPGLIPSIAGRPESVLLSQLRAFKSDNPPANTTIMNRLVKGFSDEEIAALAQHFSQIKTQPGKEGQ
ncbi:hypothetical protein L1889_05030 [Paenalcaligenes niemegkensis]|uniref:c-type cytochrome n=1 Tax=Paenalcaligenes niemegkensis TaxID=2895469 RepID=UPI001EE8C265|nr:c-type cytochrome [Paenalcaligenes niemegkensis]MCQ9616144.1 hypothetical protein [Paenalcaligenes niemegkensis]